MCLVGQFALLLGTLFHYCLVGNVLPMICLVGNGFPYLPCWWLARLLFFALLACFSNYLLCRPIICLRGEVFPIICRVGMFFQWFAFLADYLPWWHVSSNYCQGFSNYLPSWQGFSIICFDGMFFIIPCRPIICLRGKAFPIICIVGMFFPIICFVDQLSAWVARFFQLSALLTGSSNYLPGLFQLFRVFPIICLGGNFLLCLGNVFLCSCFSNYLPRFFALLAIICLVGDVFPSICLVGRFSKYLLARFFPIRGLVGNVFPCWHVFPLPKYLPCWLFALVATFSQLFSDSSSIEPIGRFPGRSVTLNIQLKNPESCVKIYPEGKIISLCSNELSPSSICPNGQVNPTSFAVLKLPQWAPLSLIHWFRHTHKFLWTQIYLLQWAERPSPSECKRSRMSTHSLKFGFVGESFRVALKWRKEMLDYWWQFFPRLGRFTSTYGFESWRWGAPSRCRILKSSLWEFLFCSIVNFCSRSSSGLRSAWTWRNLLLWQRARLKLTLPTPQILRSAPIRMFFRLARCSH